MTDSVVVEGYVKFRDGKKWKTRWVVLRKPSPVADCLVLLVYKDKVDKAQGHRERGSITLEDICGLDTSLGYEGVGYTLAILCLSQVAVLGFDSKEALQAWDVRIRYSLGEVHRFSVGILPGTRLESGPAHLHLCNNLLVLARETPPLVIGQWNLPDLRRYGPVPNGFVFEGGTRCGYWAGVFFLSSTEGEQISFLFDCVVRGISPTRGPFGLRPVLPDPSVSRAHSEERANHEAQELEKRLSILSHQGSTASSTYGPSLAGDDRSISGSSDTSDTSQSDCSVGSRLAMWTEPVASPAPTDITGPLGSKMAVQSEEKLSINQVGGARLAAKPPLARQLQEIGRQSSSDSGIATGTHSSYSGSFSSYTGSINTGAGEGDFGSVLSLPPHLALDLSPCTCPPAPRHEYQVPSSLRYLYDTPKSLLQDGSKESFEGNEPPTSTQDNDVLVPPSLETEGDKEPTGNCIDITDTLMITEPIQGPSEEGEGSGTTPGGSPHLESWLNCSSPDASSKVLLVICSTCGGFKGTPCALGVSSAMPAIPADGKTHGALRGAASCGEYKVMSVKATTATATSPPSYTIHSSEAPRLKTKTRQKKGRETLASLLADLTGNPNTVRELDAMANRLSLYESMASAFGQDVHSKPCPIPGTTSGSNSQRDKAAVIYENCFKCKGKHCRPPPRGTRPLAFGGNPGTTLKVDQRNFNSGGQLLSSEPCPKRSSEHNKPTNEVPSVDHVAPGEDSSVSVKVHTGATEDKKLRGKEERHKGDPAYEIMESRVLEKNSESEEKSKYQLMGSCCHQKVLAENEGAVFVFPPEVSAPERPRGESATYVNIPISPTSKKQLNYMELGLQEHRPVGHHAVQRKSSTKYAQIDITATETAHKVGTLHALGREEGLHTLEQRRRGAPV